MPRLVKINQVLHRRSLLAVGGAALAMVLGPVRSQAYALDESAKPVPPPPIIDCHLHCFAGDADPRFPYHQRAPYRPAAAASPELLLANMAGAGVDAAIVVHPEPYQDDHSYLAHCLDVGKGKLKGTALVFADTPDAVQQLKDLVKQMPIVATRIHAYAPERLPPFGSPQLRELWRCAAELGIAVQLHFEPRYAPRFEPLIREFADTPVIIDHLGRPFQGTPAEHQVVVRWANFSNTWMKVSALAEPTQYPHRDIRPIIAQLCHAYGPDRMIYGGGFNAQSTSATYTAAIARTAAFLDTFSPADRDKVLGGNAKRLFFT